LPSSLNDFARLCRLVQEETFRSFWPKVWGDFLEGQAETWFARDRPYRVAANLPYNVSTPVLGRLLRLAREGRVSDAVLMLQKEVADRLVAQPGSGDYGPLAIAMALQADVSRVFVLPPGAFRPPPKVHSAVVRMTFRPDRVAIADLPRFESLVRHVFTQRRKMLGTTLQALAKGEAEGWRSVKWTSSWGVRSTDPNPLTASETRPGPTSIPTSRSTRPNVTTCRTIASPCMALRLVGASYVSPLRPCTRSCLVDQAE